MTVLISLHSKKEMCCEGLVIDNTTVTEIPVEIWVQILGRLCFHDLRNIETVSSYVRSVVKVIVERSCILFRAIIIEHKLYLKIYQTLEYENLPSVFYNLLEMSEDDWKMSKYELNHMVKHFFQP